MMHNDNNAYSFITTMFGGIVALIGGLSTTEWMAVIGAALAIAGFAVNTWAVIRRDKREQKEFEARVRPRGDDDEAA